LAEKPALQKKSLLFWSRKQANNAIPILGPSSLRVVMAQPNERHANRTASVLEWYDRHRAYNNCFKRRSDIKMIKTKIK